MSAIELISIAGYSLLVGWMLVSFYWLFCDFPPYVPIEVRDLTQLWAFIGIPAGYVVLHVAGQSPRFNLFSVPALAVEMALGIVLPVAAFAMYNGILLPLWAACVSNFLAGLSFSALNVGWLDIPTRLKSQQYGRFAGLSFLGGGLLFCIATFSPETAQPLFSLIFIVASTALLYYATKNAEGNDERAPLESTVDTWKFSREVEPSLFMFGVVFAFTFVYLFNYGQTYVLIGLLFVLPGAAIIAGLSISHHELGITSIQRILTFVTVAACIITPFTSGWVQLGCACLVVAAWALLTCVNGAFIVKKCSLARDVPFFRQAPAKLAPAALGFATGWIIATVITMMFGAHSDAFTFVRLGTAVVLVAVVMLFIPVEDRHNVDGRSESEVAKTATVVSVSMSEQELFEARCDAVAKLYQLSPRESDILRFLAKGRNASYIQEKLTISPHTVKSHIYNIYRKVDIHSQQKLMDFVEDFPIDSEEK